MCASSVISGPRLLNLDPCNPPHRLGVIRFYFIFLSLRSVELFVMFYLSINNQKAQKPPPQHTSVPDDALLLFVII